MSCNPTLKSVVISGAGTGIGRALALRLAQRGVEVLGIGRRGDALAETKSLSSDLVTTLVADVSDQHSLPAITQAAQGLMRPTGLVHLAGQFQAGRLLSLDVDSIAKSLDVNVLARLRLSGGLMPYLTDGRVLFIGSDSAAIPRFGAGSYCIAQAASHMLQACLKPELGEHGVAVGSFKPGLVQTDMVRGFMQTPSDEFPDMAAYQALIDRGDVSTPATIAEFMTFLLLDTTGDEFSDTQWDVRETSHHPRWLDGTLFVGG